MHYIRIGVASLFLTWATAAAAQEPAGCATAGKLDLHAIANVPVKLPSALHLDTKVFDIIFKVVLGSDGVPKDVSIDRPSPSPELDALAIDQVRKNWRWKPPTFDCKPAEVELWPEMSYTGVLQGSLISMLQHSFRINATAADYPSEASRTEQGTAKFEADITSDGAIKSLDLKRTSGFDDLDAAAAKVVQSHHYRSSDASATHVNIEVAFARPPHVVENTGPAPATAAIAAPAAAAVSAPAITWRSITDTDKVADHTQRFSDRLKKFRLAGTIGNCAHMISEPVGYGYQVWGAICTLTIAGNPQSVRVCDHDDGRHFVYEEQTSSGTDAEVAQFTAKACTAH